MDFNFAARTREGLHITLTVKCQYMLDANSKFLEMYLKFGKDYETPCKRYATNDLSIKTKDYPVVMFFRNLTIVS